MLGVDQGRGKLGIHLIDQLQRSRVGHSELHGCSGDRPRIVDCLEQRSFSGAKARAIREIYSYTQTGWRRFGRFHS